MGLVSRTFRILGGAIALVAATGLGSGFARAADQDLSSECTWFPDLRCERTSRWDGFIPPMSAPFLFEDPFITTGISAYGLWHEFPEKGVFTGGEARALALQARVAVTDRLALIATKDGIVDFRPDTPLVDNQNGFLDLAGGIKYALYVDPKRELIITPVLRFEFSNGTRRILAGNGDGVFIPSISIGKGLTDRIKMLADVGERIPFDTDAESQVLFYNTHLSYQLTKRLTPFVEFNGLTYLTGGDGTSSVRLAGNTHLSISQVQTALGLPGFEGVDLLNLGSRNVRGHDIITGALGMRLSVGEGRYLGFSYERPLTDRRDIFKQRFTLNFWLDL